LLTYRKIEDRSLKLTLDEAGEKRQKEPKRKEQSSSKDQDYRAVQAAAVKNICTKCRKITVRCTSGPKMKY